MRIVRENMPALPAVERDALIRCLSAMGAAMPCRRIILFGSRARGDANQDSDVDLCIISDHVTSQFGAACRLRRAIGRIRGKPALSIIPVSPLRLAEKQKSGDPFFTSVLQEGVTLAEEN